MMKEKPEEAAKVADAIIRNTYRTLLIRWQKGCIVYCTDQELTDYLKRRMRMVVDYDAEAFFGGDLRVAEENEEYE